MEINKKSMLLLINLSSNNSKSIIIGLCRFMVQEYCLQDIPMLAMLIKSNNILEKHQGVIGIRRIVCKINDCMDQLFAANILGELVLFMKQN